MGLLHAENDQIELARIDVVGRSRGKRPRQLFDATSSNVSRPLIGKRTTVPSRLISSAVGFVQTSETRFPAINNLVLNSEP